MVMYIESPYKNFFYGMENRGEDIVELDRGKKIFLLFHLMLKGGAIVLVMLVSILVKRKLEK